MPYFNCRQNTVASLVVFSVCTPWESLHLPTSRAKNMRPSLSVYDVALTYLTHLSKPWHFTSLERRERELVCHATRSSG